MQKTIIIPTDEFSTTDVSTCITIAYANQGAFGKLTQCQVFSSAQRGFDIMSIIMKLRM